MSTSLSEATGKETARDRRLIMRAVDYWESVQGDFAYPRMMDFDIDAVPEMAAQSFLIDINMKNVQMSQLRYVGDNLVHSCSRDLIGKPVSSVPRGSLISRLTDHFIQILANRAPMSFEAEYNDASGMVTKYRGIMMPLSNTGQDIDCILGVINSRSDQGSTRPAPKLELADAVTVGALTASAPDASSESEMAVIAEFPQTMPSGFHSAAHPSGIPVDAVCDMLEDLRECRGAAYMVQDAQERLQRREFKALEKAFRLLHAAREAPLVFAGLLEECEQRLNDQDLVATILKLVFGNDYPREEMTLYATVLRRALRDRQTPDTLMRYLEGLEGGLKGLAQEEPIPLNMEGLLRPR